ncbi:MAG: hypothetical protein QME82_04235, partial [Bacillota bacterium]|nr:hypothetical protein [Bacillota bacterium]
LTIICSAPQRNRSVSTLSIQKDAVHGKTSFKYILTPGAAFLSDLNEDLINAYLVVKTDCEALLQSLRRHKNRWPSSTK